MSEVWGVWGVWRVWEVCEKNVYFHHYYAGGPRIEIKIGVPH
nr:hypothetical protein [Okeania sp. SIO2F4]